MVLANTGISSSAGNVINVDLNAPLALPAMPGIVQFLSPKAPAFSNLVQAYFSSPFYLSDAQVKAAVLASVEKIQHANEYKPQGAVVFVEFNDHAPYALQVPVEAIAEGFYEKVNDLQGVRRTWYTGAACYGEDAGGIWQWFENNILPRIVSALKA